MRVSFIFLLLQLWRNVEVSSSQNGCSVLPIVPHADVSEDTKKAEYQAGNEIHFTCETGYISGLAITYVCSPTSGRWVAGRRGKCSLKPCPFPDDTPNGYYQIINGEEFVFGTTIKYFCNKGYQMVSKDDTRTCWLDNWSNHVPICDPLSCEQPPVEEGFRIEGLPENDDPILPDRFLKFSCDGRGKYLNGSSLLICGKDGQWDNPFPSCEDITCEVDVMQPHLHVTGLPPANGKMKVGQILRFHCDDQFIIHGSEEIECLPTGRWNAILPTCAEKCKVAGVSNSVHLITHVPNNQLRRGQKLRFACINPKHILHGKAEVECLANGHWSDPFPICGAPFGCLKSPPLPDGDTVGHVQFTYNHGERVGYVCQYLYTMEGEPYKTCHNGEWIGQMRCLKPCTVDEEAMRLHNIEYIKMTKAACAPY
ncbi:complement factor H-like [Anoplopoma fimbria]|uniref:complement factor H-like n=1 Tax=Anoplopoma fimbria TaxID=229290 RepID=UPI0023EBF9C2|nr:complement factor H-like [Anoplopoma fimbria]